MRAGVDYCHCNIIQAFHESLDGAMRTKNAPETKPMLAG